MISTSPASSAETRVAVSGISRKVICFAAGAVSQYCCEKPSGGGGSGDPLDGDLVAEGFEASDEPPFEGVLVAAVEEVGAEVVEVGAVLEEVVGDDEDRAGDGDGRGVLAAPGGQAT